MERLIKKILIIGLIGIILLPCNTKAADDDFDILLYMPVMLAAANGDKGYTCGAYVAPGVWKEFACYNLAAIGKTTGDDPFTPSWRLIGGYWQWGRKGPDESEWYDTNTFNFAHGPTGSDEADTNDDEIYLWDNSYAADGAWSDDEKTENDPCPSGYRVPTEAQWDGVDENNTQSSVGTWSADDNNYSSGYFFGNSLMLPAAGYRSSSTGELYSRGEAGRYLSTTEGSISSWAEALHFSDDEAHTQWCHRSHGFSVRCIAKDSETCTDEDGDGYYAETDCGTEIDCDDTNGDIHPGAEEVCDNDIDDDCDGYTDEDCTTTCGAYVAPGVWKEFDCYNLAAIGKTTGDDPFTPSWRLIGGYWQWGRKGPDESEWYDTNSSNFAHGPTSADETDANDDDIDDWDTSYATDSTWSDEKTENDPCPSGYRVPTEAQWEGVDENNTQSSVGTWSADDTNYYPGYFFGNSLMLPAAGYRSSSTGELYSRGEAGRYLSTTEGSISSWAEALYFSDDDAHTQWCHRTHGFSVRCIAE